MRQSVQRLHQRATPSFVGYGRPPILMNLLFVALLSLGNPFACLLHCWYHQHVASPHAPDTDQPAVSQPHHSRSHTVNVDETESTKQTPSTANSSPTLSCSPIHHTASALTIAVLLSPLWIIIPFRPGVSLARQQLFLRLVTRPPPLQPPRLHHA